MNIGMERSAGSGRRSGEQAMIIWMDPGNLLAQFSGGYGQPMLSGQPGCQAFDLMPVARYQAQRFPDKMLLPVRIHAIQGNGPSGHFGDRLVGFRR